MKYDLIVVGGGPGGLMAARTAAEDGLKVIVVERKRNIAEIHRSCVQIFYLLKKHPVSGRTRSDGYIDPVSVESYADKTRFNFPVPGFSLDFHGCLRPYLNWLHLSPSGNIIYRYEVNERPWGFYFDKEALVAELLAEVEKAGVEVRSETLGLGAENTKDGVRVRVKTKSGEETLEARRAIAADGNGSKIVESLGLNKNRKVFRGGISGVASYIVEGVETGLLGSTWLTWAVPSINRDANIWLGMWANNRHVLETSATDPFGVLNKFMSDARYAPMFRHARVVKKDACTMRGITPAPIKEPVAGNVVIVGDAASPGETWVQGAVACGYQAVKAIEKELDGQSGYPEFCAWWQQAFAFNATDYMKLIPDIYNMPKVCSDEEVDYIYNLLRDKIGPPLALANNNLELIKAGRPELYEKLTRGKA